MSEEEIKRKRVTAGAAFYELVLLPEGITIDMLTGDELVTERAAKAMGKLTGTTTGSWYCMDHKKPVDLKD